MISNSSLWLTAKIDEKLLLHAFALAFSMKGSPPSEEEAPVARAWSTIDAPPILKTRSEVSATGPDVLRCPTLIFFSMQETATPFLAPVQASEAAFMTVRWLDTVLPLLAGRVHPDAGAAKNAFVLKLGAPDVSPTASCVTWWDAICHVQPTWGYTSK